MGRLNKTELEKAIDYAEKKGQIRISSEDINELSKVISNGDLLAELIVKTIEYNNNHNIITNKNSIINSISTFCIELYSLVVTNDSNYSLFVNLYLRTLGERSIVTKDSIKKAYISFNDKNLVLETFEILKSIQPDENVDDNNFRNTKSNILHLLNYLVLARSLYVDDRALFTSFVNLVSKIGKEIIIYGSYKEISNFIQERLKLDEKTNGMYDVDQAMLEENARLLESLGVEKEKILSYIETAEKVKEKLESLVDASTREIKDVSASELKHLKEEIRRNLTEFNAKYEELLNTQRKGLVEDRVDLVAEFERILDEKRLATISLFDDISKTIEIQIRDIRSAANSQIDRITNYVQTDDNIQRIIDGHQKNADFLDKIKIVSDQIEKTVIVSPTAEVGQNQAKTIIQTDLKPQMVVASHEIIDEPVDYTVIYYFDKSYQYKERFKKLMEKKAELEANGEIFHQKFDDVVVMLIQNESPYLWGPSGCGKTYMIETQIPLLFDQKVVTGGYITFEQDVLGFMNVGTGLYVPTVFYKGYKYGDMMFYDEIDKSNANGANVLLPFMNRTKNQKHTFPDGISIPRHPNFRLITAGNTRLTGSTIAYNTSKKLDESINQRVMFVEIGYDNRIEMSILRDYKGWYEFCVKFRNALEKSGPASSTERNSLGTITSRDAQSIKDHLDDGSLSDEKLMEYHVVENKESDYLFQITNNLEKETFETSDGKKLLKIYKKMVIPKIRDFYAN